MTRRFVQVRTVSQGTVYVNLERVRWLKALAQGAQQRAVFVFGPRDELVADESLESLVHRIQRGEPR